MAHFAARRLRQLPAVLALGIGMCVAQTVAVWRGLTGGMGQFELA